MSVDRRSFLAAGAAWLLTACRGRSHSARRQPVSRSASSTSGPGASASSAGVLGAGHSGPARFVTHGSTGSPTVAFTFHGSGDVGLLHDLLDEAKRAAAPITVFAVGNWLDANPGVAKTILQAGHELANHTYTHPTLTRLSQPAVAAEIGRCRDALVRHGANGGLWFRPSGTPVPTAGILEEAGRAGYRTVVGYDIDPLDYQDPGAAAIERVVRSELHAGAIVSLHTGHRGTVEAFAALIAATHDHGLRPVRLGELIGSQ